MNQHFHKPYRNFAKEEKVKAEISNYAIKAYLKYQQKLIHLN